MMHDQGGDFQIRRKPADDAGIFIAKKVDRIIKPGKKAAADRSIVVTQKDGAKSGAQCQGIKGRKDNRGRNGNGKLLINFAGNAGHQADRDKNRQQNKSGGDNGAGNLLHCLN